MLITLEQTFQEKILEIDDQLKYAYDLRKVNALRKKRWELLNKLRRELSADVSMQPRLPIHLRVETLTDYLNLSQAESMLKDALGSNVAFTTQKQGENCLLVINFHHAGGRQQIAVGPQGVVPLQALNEAGIEDLVKILQILGCKKICIHSEQQSHPHMALFIAKLTTTNIEFINSAAVNNKAATAFMTVSLSPEYKDNTLTI